LRQIEDLLEDAQQALAYVRAQPMVDSRCCGILGYGVGAPLAATLAREDGRLLTIAMLAPLIEWDVLLPIRPLLPGRKQRLGIPEVGPLCWRLTAIWFFRYCWFTGIAIPSSRSATARRSGPCSRRRIAA
ncbi:MAG: hypothetical protein QF437_20165, partial [Planctomycetota bacterium]|nr:hypothetical protein [Planctomycetota bacterium]